MCGITGILNFDSRPVNERELRRMTDRIAHRGPDGAGYHFFGHAALGHRRLAIIDLAGGAQPLPNENGTIWVSFNGEIYNYQELHKELQALGHTFRTSSDTEVIVHGYEEWGEACVERFRGMFAFAVWDDGRQTLFLARDRLGIKPLVYWKTSERFCFASELQALEELDQPPKAVDLEAIDYYLELLYIPSPRTVYREVCKLPPAHTLTVSRDGRMTQRRYWSLRYSTAGEPRAAQEWVDCLEDSLNEAVRLHLIADVPVGAFLSGGLDSSAVVAVMCRALAGPAQTFTMTFEDQEYNEATAAREVAQYLRTDHHEQLVDLDVKQVLPRMVRHHGEPFADSSAVPTFAVCALARRHVKVVLSGDGGDEAFAGYPWLLGLIEEFEAPASSAPRALKRCIRRTLGNWPLLQDFVNPLRMLERVRSCFNRRLRKRLWQRKWASVTLERTGLLDRTLPKLRGLDLCAQVQMLDYQWYLPEDILAKVDIASMSQGLEVRVPLLDHCLVELAGRLPAALKYRAQNNGEGRGVVGKYVLRQLLARYLPASVADRPKRGFGLPLHRWRAAADGKEIRESLFRRSSRLAELFCPNRLQELVGSADLRKSGGSQLWTLLVLGEWFHQHPTAELAVN